MKKLSALCQENGIRDKVILIAGGTQVTRAMAAETGLDATFGRGTKRIHVVDAMIKTLNSSVKTIELLSRAAQLLRRSHKVIVMVNVGDLCEAVWPDRVVSVVREAAKFPNIEIVGLGANLACYGGSSDHLVLDVEQAEHEVRLGDEIAFYPTYGSLLAATTSPYMQKVVIKD
jgi:predicted amino acid racemase